MTLLRLFTLFTLSVLMACNTSVGSDPNDAFERLLKEQYEARQSLSPVSLSIGGDLSRNGEWPDMSLEAKQSERDLWRQQRDQLLALEKPRLSSANQLNLELAVYDLEDRMAEYDIGGFLLPLTMREGPQTAYDLIEYLNFSSEQDYRDWISRLTALPNYLDQHIDLMREGIRRGVVQPRVVMDRVSTQLAALQVEDPTQSAFYKPFEDMDFVAEDDLKADLQAAAQEAIANRVLPAYAEFATFFNEEYLAACREEVGVGATDWGRSYYEYLVRHFTTTDKTPQEIHHIGLSEVERIRAEMESIRQEVGFDGDLSEFFIHLRTDPQFFYDTPEELFEAYLATSKRLDPELVNLFGRLPRTPYGVRAIPDAIAPDTTIAYYMPPAEDGSRAGYYYVNLYKPETRPIWGIEVLSVHEAVPGHHLQISLAMERAELPAFRRSMGVGAYVEGWGLYSERLGYDMGLYQDPYSRFGQLAYDMWRSVRLVVDTGMHYMGWTRDEAIEYFKSNSPKSELDIVNEIDRYIGWPGQALGYKIGQLKILELRERAEAQLGDKFDIREFHDQLLSTGAVPLSVMETELNAWIEEKRIEGV